MPPFCMIFYVDSENGNESLPGLIFTQKNKVFDKHALITKKSIFSESFRFDKKFFEDNRGPGAQPLGRAAPRAGAAAQGRSGGGGSPPGKTPRASELRV